MTLTRPSATLSRFAGEGRSMSFSRSAGEGAAKRRMRESQYASFFSGGS
jgi:hypothetical protein